MWESVAITMGGPVSGEWVLSRLFPHHGPHLSQILREIWHRSADHNP
jgi:hypothetical protein